MLWNWRKMNFTTIDDIKKKVIVSYNNINSNEFILKCIEYINQ